MLYNPQWERIWTVEGFARWLAQQPPEKAYDWHHPEHCAAGQYLAAMGVGSPGLDPDELRDLDWYDITVGWFGEDSWTFGKATRRAYKELGWRYRWYQFWRQPVPAG